MKGIFSNSFINIGVLLIISSASVILSSFLLSYIDNYEKSYQNGKNIENEVKSLYNDYLDKVSIYKKDVGIVYNSYNLYLEDMLSTSDSLITSIEKVKNDKSGIDVVVNELDSKCSNKINSGDFVIRCESYNESLEEINNIYDKMIDDYNDIIRKYNTYANNNNKETIDLYRR